MKNFILFLILLCPVVVLAQPGKAAKRLLPAALKPRPAEMTAFTAGNMKINLSYSMLKNHGADLIRTHLDRKLEPAVYKHLAAQNDRRMLLSLQRLAKNREIFFKNKNKIAASRQVHAAKGKISYASYLPKDLKTLYIGEWHNIPGVEEEVESLLRQLPNIYPGRRIYLATEFLPSNDWNASVKQKLITTPGQLVLLSRYRTNVFCTALEAGMTLVPLEDLNRMLGILWSEMNSFPTETIGQKFSISFEGVHLRNQIWMDTLRELRRMDPEALIVVYAGFGHVSYHADSNLPHWLGGSSFVMSFVQPKHLVYDNPFARYLPMPANVLAKFNASPDVKLVESWKTRAYKKILGADLTVILPSQK